MSLLETIVNKIFHPTQPSQGIPASIAAPNQDPSTTLDSSAHAPTDAKDVDLEQVMTQMQKAKSTSLNWKTSIVDLMKLLDMDSGLEARQQLARELGYDGSTTDTATMNTWLHKAVMKRVADNGGRVPADLQH